MKVLLETSSDTVSVGGETVAGPLQFEADKVTHGVTEYNQGVILVRSGEVVRLSEWTEAGKWGLPISTVVGLVLGVLAARFFALRGLGVLLLLLLASPASAYTLYHTSQVVNNSGPTFERYRATVYAVDHTAAAPTGNYFIPAATRNFSTTSTGHRAIQVQIRNGLGAVLWESGVISTNGGTGLPGSAGIIAAYPVSYPYISNAGGPNWSWWVRIWQSGTSAWGSYTAYNPQLVPTTEYSEEVYERGAILNQWEFDLAAFSSITLNIEQSEAFYLVVDQVKQVGTPDGGYNYAYEELDEYTSTSFTSEEPEPESTTEVGPPEYDPGDTATPATRPGTVDSTATLNQAQEARHTDEKGVLEQIRDGVGAGVNTASGAATKASADAAAIKGALDQLNAGDGEGVGGTTAADVADDEETIAEKGAELYDGIEDMSDAVEGFADQLMLSVGSSAEYPAIVFPVPSILGGGNITIDFAEWASWIQLIRGLMLLVVTFYMGIKMLETARGAFA